MRHSALSTRRILGGLFGVLTLSGAAVGCVFEPGNFCTDQPDNCGAGGNASTSTSMASQMTTTSMGMTTSDSSSSTGVPQECDPLKLTAGASIEPTCGIFVEPGKTGDGKQATPFGTLAEALTNNPMDLPIYVCATAATGLTEAIVLGAAEKVIGGVTCGDWKATTTKTPWTAGTNAVPLTLDHTTGALVQGFAITAANAMGSDGATLQGNSSIGVIADAATATLESIDVVAGTGAAGGDGMDQAGRAPGRTDFAALFDGNVGGGCNGMGGLAKDYAMCPAGGGTTEGGKGGDGGNLTGSAGNAGAPALGLGAAGMGDNGNAGWTCAANSGNGGFGNSALDGSPGAGGATSGTLTAAGFLGDPGKPGGVGILGQGGGGGGGRKKAADACGTSGTSGGGGGAGGCGGLSGGGGGAGGASIALVSLDSVLTATNLHLTAAAGGIGGDGGDGQLGGIGGNGANGGGSACKGGDGGKGGDGAGGGGGKGGPSIGLASVGAAPDIADANITTSMTAAAGGAPGGGSVPGLPGAMGDTPKKLAF